MLGTHPLIGPQACEEPGEDRHYARPPLTTFDIERWISDVEDDTKAV